MTLADGDLQKDAWIRANVTWAQAMRGLKFLEEKLLQKFQWDLERIGMLASLFGSKVEVPDLQKLRGQMLKDDPGTSCQVRDLCAHAGEGCKTCPETRKKGI